MSIPRRFCPQKNGVHFSRLASTRTNESLFRNSCRRPKSIQVAIKAAINNVHPKRPRHSHLPPKKALPYLEKVLKEQPQPATVAMRSRHVRVVGVFRDFVAFWGTCGAD